MRWVASIGLLVACGTSSTEPSVASITPALGLNSDTTPVEIHGANLHVPLFADLDHGTSAESVNVMIGSVPLDDVTLVDDQTLTGVVPAGMPTGPYDVVVQLGRRTLVLDDSFTVVGATLSSTLTIPGLVGRGSVFNVRMDVHNNGAVPVTALEPSVLTVSGTASATLVAAPASGMTIDPAATVTLTWQYRATTLGTLAFRGSATGTDTASGSPITSQTAMSGTANVVETISVDNPFMDGTPFGYVAGYRGKVFIGPSADGSTAVRVNADGSAPQTISFAFLRDTSGLNTSSNASASMTTIGATGCSGATCGPDGENGRGLFTSAVMGGDEWLVIGGARSSGDLDYIYMSNDSATQVTFRFVDLSPFMGGATRGFSSSVVFKDRLYLGFPDSGGARPYFVALFSPPTMSPGLDTSLSTAINLDGDKFPGWNVPSAAMVDTLAVFNDALYAASSAGVVASTVDMPRPYGTFPQDWSVATPSSNTYSAKTSRTTTKLADLEPIDKAFPQMAGFGGRLFAGRNTTTGPQVWVCNPSGGASATRCDPGDWRLLATNSTLDPQLTQFDDPTLTSITMVVATDQYLYLGFDSLTGVRVLRTANSDATTAAEFEAVGGPGLGITSTTRIFDAQALTRNDYTTVWITVGDGTAPLRVVAIP